MFTIDDFDPSLSNEGSFNTRITNPCSRLVLFNESNITLTLFFADGSEGILPAWVAKVFYLRNPSTYIRWKKRSVLQSGSVPISLVQGEVYEASEEIIGAYPISLVRQANIGNPGGVETSVTSTNAIVNTNNPLNTSIIDVTPTGASGKTFQADNTGDLKVAEYVAGTLTTLLDIITGATIALKLGNTNRAIQLLGDLLIPISSGNARLYGNATQQRLELELPSGSPAISFTTDGFVTPNDLGIGSNGTHRNTIAVAGGVLNVKGQNSIQFQVPNGTTRVSIDSGGLTISSGNLTLTTGSIARSSTFTGAATGFYNHNNGNTPAVVNPFCSVSGSQTMGWDSPNSTQVRITSGAGLSFKAWAIGF